MGRKRLCPPWEFEACMVMFAMSTKEEQVVAFVEEDRRKVWPH